MKTVLLVCATILLVSCSSQTTPLPTVASLPDTESNTSDSNLTVDVTATPARENSLDPILEDTSDEAIAPDAGVAPDEVTQLQAIGETSDSVNINQVNNSDATVGTATPVTSTVEDVWFVTITSSADAHACADVNCDILNTFDAGTPVRVLAIENGWHQIRLPFGGDAYVRSDLLFLPANNETVQNPSSNTNTNTGNQVQQQPATTAPQQQPPTQQPSFTATPPGADNPLVTPDTNQPPPGNGPPPGA